MEIVQTVLTPALLAFVALAGGYLFKERLDRLESRVDRLVDQMGQVMGQMGQMATRAEVNSRFERIEIELAAVRSDLTQIALAVGTQTRPQTG
jgi:tetrahydromethanopterin S-methyltransferase subunit G